MKFYEILQNHVKFCRILKKITTLETKWANVFMPQLKTKDEDNLLDEWDEKVQDASTNADHTMYWSVESVQY